MEISIERRLASFKMATPSEVSEVQSLGDAALQTEDELVSTRCCTCHKPVDIENSLVIVRASNKTPTDIRRCRSCHNVRSAIERLKKNNGNLVKDWSKVEGDRLTAFYQENAHLRGEDLRKKVEEVVQDWKVSVTRFEFSADGEFLDEHDLQEKYKNKPDVLENILKNARQYYCPIKRVQLYADPKYTSKVSDSMELGHSEKRKGQAVLDDNTDMGPTKRKKGEKDKNTSLPAGEEPKLKAGAKKKLTKKMDATNAKCLQLSSLLTKCGSLGDMIPKYVATAAESVTAAAQSAISKAQACIDAGKGDANPLIEELDGHISSINEAYSRLRSQVELAENFTRPSCEMLRGSPAHPCLQTFRCGNGCVKF